MSLEAPTVCLSVCERKTSRVSPIVCYGLKNGNIGALELNGEESIVLWEVDCAEEGKAPCAFIEVTTIKDELHLVVARDDGSIELYWFEEKSASANLVFETKQDETITGLACGFITSATKKEIIFTCFSGAVKSIIDKKAVKRLGTLQEDPKAAT